LEALLKASKQLEQNLSQELILKAYQIEKKYQFDKDRDEAIKEMEKLMNDEADLIQARET
jgi:hypothetical protein